MRKCIYIVTPCFNAVETIEETLHSVYNQRGNYIIRYHVQDGSSSDGTQEKLEKFAQGISRAGIDGSFIFSWASQPDNGMYHALNLAVEYLNIPKKAFMGWINADDLIYDGCFMHLFQVVERFPQVQWVGGKMMIEDMAGNVIAEGGDEWYNQKFIQNGLCDGSHWAYIQQEGTFWQKWLWDAAGGINTNFRLAGDWDLWRRMAQHAPYIQLPWYMGVFRKRPGQLSQNLMAYNNEIASVSPIRMRAKALRKMCRSLSNLSASIVLFTPSGKIQLAQKKLVPSWKMRIRLLLLGFGFYSFVTFCQKVLRTLKGCKELV